MADQKITRSDCGHKRVEIPDQDTCPFLTSRTRKLKVIDRFDPKRFFRLVTFHQGSSVSHSFSQQLLDIN